MKLNQNTVRRVLFLLPGILPAALLWTALMAVPACLAAQDKPAPALLVSGPEYVEGIPFLPANGLPARRGRYEYLGSRVMVYYTAEPILLQGGWSGFTCGNTAYRTSVYDGGKVYFFDSARGWSVFLFFQDETVPVCPFMDLFFDRLNYFKGISPVFSFPAVLELP